MHTVQALQHSGAITEVFSVHQLRHPGQREGPGDLRPARDARAAVLDSAPRRARRTRVRRRDPHRDRTIAMCGAGALDRGKRIAIRGARSRAGRGQGPADNSHPHRASRAVARARTVRVCGAVDRCPKRRLGGTSRSARSRSGGRDARGGYVGRLCSLCRRCDRQFRVERSSRPVGRRRIRVGPRHSGGGVLRPEGPGSRAATAIC